MVTALTFFRQESLLSAVQVSNQCEDTLIQLCSFIYNMFLLGVLCIQQVFDGKRHGFHPKMEYQVFLCIFQNKSGLDTIPLFLDDLLIVLSKLRCCFCRGFVLCQNEMVQSGFKCGCLDYHRNLTGIILRITLI